MDIITTKYEHCYSYFKFPSLMLSFKGFHDIAITLLLVLGEEQSLNILSRLAQTHFQLFMGKDMEQTTEILNLVYVLVKKENPTLYEYLVR